MACICGCLVGLALPFLNPFPHVFVCHDLNFRLFKRADNSKALRKYGERTFALHSRGFVSKLRQHDELKREHFAEATGVLSRDSLFPVEWAFVGERACLGASSNEIESIVKALPLDARLEILNRKSQNSREYTKRVQQLLLETEKELISILLSNPER